MADVDAFGRPIIANNMVGISDPTILMASPVDAPNQVSEKPDQAIARLTAEAMVIREKITALGGKLEGLPEISGMSPSDLQNVVDTYERKRAEVADKAAMEFQAKAMGALGLVGAGAAGVGVASPEIAEAITEKNKLPINKELEAALKNAGGKETFRMTGVTGGKEVDKDNIGLLALDEKLPNPKAAELAKVTQKDAGMQRALA